MSGIPPCTSRGSSRASRGDWTVLRINVVLTYKIQIQFLFTLWQRNAETEVVKRSSDIRMKEDKQMSAHLHLYILHLTTSLHQLVCVSREEHVKNCSQVCSTTFSLVQVFRENELSWIQNKRRPHTSCCSLTATSSRLSAGLNPDRIHERLCVTPPSVKMEGLTDFTETHTQCFPLRTCAAAIDHCQLIDQWRL